MSKRAVVVIDIQNDYFPNGKQELVGIEKAAANAEISRSSGYDRLDRTALETALRWRYVPGKRAGVPEAMWFNVPINFVLE